jgi:hypothetical protein
MIVGISHRLSFFEDFGLKYVSHKNSMGADVQAGNDLGF